MTSPKASVRDVLEAGHDLEQGGLARAVGANDADLGAGVHADGHIIEDHLVVDCLAGVVELVDELGHGTSLLVGLVQPLWIDSTLL